MVTKEKELYRFFFLIYFLLLKIFKKSKDNLKKLRKESIRQNYFWKLFFILIYNKVNCCIILYLFLFFGV